MSVDEREREREREREGEEKVKFEEKNILFIIGR